VNWQAAKAECTVDDALRYSEDPNSVTRRSERVLALEVRRLRMVEIDLKQDVWDWQKRAEEAEAKLALNQQVQPPLGQQSALDVYAKSMLGSGGLIHR
jgi:hypothetical protein